MQPFQKIDLYFMTSVHYISGAMSNFYGKEIEFWAGFRPVGNTENKIGANYEQLLRLVFSCFQGQRNIWYTCHLTTLELSGSGWALASPNYRQRARGLLAPI